MSNMQEIELKFQIPEGALDAVRAEFARLNQGRSTDLRLRAAYFDTPDRRLAAARMALRVRQEGDEWVQTLKAGGSNTMMRLEDNQPAAAPTAGQPIRADLARHAGTPAREALMRVLDWAPEQDPHGERAGLVELYGTDITRTRAHVTVGAGTLFEGVVELALDLGHIHAGSLQEPVRELEIESVSGHPMAVILAGRDWVQNQGVWLDTQTKAHRGDRLARDAAAHEAGQPRPSTLSEQTTAARAAKVKATSTLDEAWRAGMEACLEHITANLSELGTAPSSTAHVAYEVRLGLRRLRALGRLWADTPWALPPVCLDKAATLSRQLGYWRDQTALAWLPDKLVAAGGPGCPVPCPQPPAGQPADAVALARSALATSLCLDVLASLLAPVHPGQDEGAPTSAQPWLHQRLNQWQHRCVRRAHGMSKLADGEWHRLRKQGKRLRLVAALYAPLWPGKAFRRHDRALKAALDALGHVQDEVVAQQWYAPLAVSDPGALFALNWLRQRRKGLRKRALRATQRWLKLSSPW